MRIVLIMLAISALAAVSAHEPAEILIRPQDIVDVRAIGDEVEIHAATPNTGAEPSGDDPIALATGFAFVIPAEFGHDLYISSAARSSKGLTLRIKLKDSQTAAAFAKFLDEKRPRI